MARLFWVCLGGAIGTGARYLFSGWLARVTGPGFPYDTLAVNAIGSFFLGTLMEAALVTESLPPMFRLTLAVGVLGGFTTYSTFNYETLQLFQEGSWLLGFANLGIQVIVCLLAGALGLVVGRLVAGW
jgi:fluoride exporter